MSENSVQAEIFQGLLAIEEGFNSFVANNVEGTRRESGAAPFIILFGLPEGDFAINPLAENRVDWIWRFLPNSSFNESLVVNLVARNAEGDIDFMPVKIPEDAVQAEAAAKEGEAAGGEPAGRDESGNTAIESVNESAGEETEPAPSGVLEGASGADEGVEHDVAAIQAAIGEKTDDPSGGARLSETPPISPEQFVPDMDGRPCSRGSFELGFDDPVFMVNGIEGAVQPDGSIRLEIENGAIRLESGADGEWRYEFRPNPGFEALGVEIAAVNAENMFKSVALAALEAVPETAPEAEEETDALSERRARIRLPIEDVAKAFLNDVPIGEEDSLIAGDAGFSGVRIADGFLECAYMTESPVIVNFRLEGANGEKASGMLIFDSVNEPDIITEKLEKPEAAPDVNAKKPEEPVGEKTEKTPAPVQEPENDGQNAVINLILPAGEGSVSVAGNVLCRASAGGEASLSSDKIRIVSSKGTVFTNFSVDRFENGILGLKCGIDCKQGHDALFLDIESEAGDKSMAILHVTVDHGKVFTACADNNAELSGTLSLPYAKSYRIGATDCHVMNNEAVFKNDALGSLRLEPSQVDDKIRWSFEPAGKDVRAQFAIAAIEDGKIIAFDAICAGREAAPPAPSPQASGGAPSLDLFLDTFGENCVVEMDGWRVALDEKTGEAQMESGGKGQGLIDTILPVRIPEGFWRLSCVFKNRFAKAIPVTVDNNVGKSKGDIVCVNNRCHVWNIENENEISNIKGLFRSPPESVFSVDGKPGTPAGDNQRFSFPEGVLNIGPENAERLHPYFFITSTGKSFEREMKVSATRPNGDTFVCATLRVSHKPAPRIMNDSGQGRRGSQRTGVSCVNIDLGGKPGRIYIGDTLITTDSENNAFYSGKNETVIGNVLFNNCAASYSPESGKWSVTCDYAVISGDKVDVKLPVRVGNDEKLAEVVVPLKLNLNQEA